MAELTFMVPSRIICAPGSLSQIGLLVKELSGTRVLIITDHGLTELGYSQRAQKILEAAGIKSFLFDEVVADPPFTVVKSAVRYAREVTADIIIGLGGGSSIDTAKVVALSVHSEQSIEDMIGNEQASGTRLPLICIPTTAGTGSEVTFASALTSDERLKKAIYSRKLLPDIAVLDAELTLDLPRHITAAPALDAIVHAVEAYTSRTRKNPISDALALKAIQLLADNFKAVLLDGRDIIARQNMLLGSMMAGMAFVNASVAAVHALSYPLGAQFHVPHGHANALVMGPIFKFNIPAAASQYAEMAAIILPGEVFESDIDAAHAFIDRLYQFLEMSGLEMRLSKLGVTEGHIPAMAHEVTDKIQRLIVTNPRDMTYEDVVEIYKGIL